MNFYFQSGEFTLTGGESWLSLAVQFLAIIVGAGISILVFQLGKIHDRTKETERLANLYTYLKNAIDSLLDPLNRQLVALNKFYDELDTTRDRNYTPEMFVTLHTKGIRWINHHDLYRIFVHPTKPKNIVDKEFEFFRKLNADLDFIDTVIDSLKQNFNLLMTKRDEYITIYNTNIKAIAEMKDTIYLEYDKKHKEDQSYQYPFFHKFDHLIAKWSQLPDYMELDIAKQEFLAPLIAISRGEKYDANTRQVLLLSNECIHALNNFDAAREFVRNSIKFMIDRLEDTRKNLGEFQQHYWSESN